ncbi:Na+/solute symporter [Desulfocucumis palustris]|uniref:Na+/solute symporter n=2 Tax=Desulfocucumis palustris TaxID=1898651 RepID=A0A2L2X9U8_9FIRM|nr:Na+/solute symporter [Desulfocucumis palustris]
MLGMGHYISLGVTLLVFCLLGLISTRMVKSVSDYLVGGRKLGPLLVAGGIVGGFVGGTVTIGTAQMAYRYGISGIWFTLGAGAACLLLFLFLARPLREKEVDTVSQFLALTYGSKAVPWVALFVGAGMFIQVSVQMVAAAPMLTAILPVSTKFALLIFAALTIFYVLGGGIWGSSLVGLLKLLLLSATLLAAAVAGWTLTGGGASLTGYFGLYPWFSLFPRGFSLDLAGGLSAVIGFISTQACIQPVFAGRDVKSARAGALAAAILIPLFGAAGVLVGMYMRMTRPDIDPAMALPLFMLEHLPPWISGAGLATLLVTMVLTSSAMALGISALFSQDIYPRLRPGRTPGERLTAARAAVFVTILAGTLMAFRTMGDLILDWSYLSNALRGVTVFAPLLAAVFFGRRVPPAAGVLAVSAAPLFAAAWALFFPGTLHPLYAGLPVSFLIIISGLIHPGLYSGFDKDKKLQR